MESVFDFELVSKIMEALAVALLLPLLSPVLKFFDRGRRRAETQRRLELLKTLAEVDGFLLPDSNSNFEKYRVEYERIIENSGELKSFLADPKLEKEPLPNPKVDSKSFSPFNWIDWICALLGPVIFTIFMLLTEDEYFITFGVFVLSVTFSLLVAKFIICRFIANGFWQGFWQIFTGIAGIIPSILIIIYTLI